MLFHFDAVGKHCTAAHQITLKAYRTEYPAFTGQTSYNNTKKIKPSVAKARTKAAAAAAVVVVQKKPPPKGVVLDFDEEKWRPTLDGSRKYLSDNLNEICLR